MSSFKMNTITVRFLRLSFALLTVWLIAGVNSDAQYFGRNKPGYSSFRFDVLQTPAFEIYHYMKND